jgi:threonine efflux protein
VGSLFWAGLALTELAALFAILPLLQTALRVVGAAFLIYLGVQLLRTPVAAPTTHHVAASGSASKAMFLGFATSVLNPKSLAYFGTIFVLFVPSDSLAVYRISAFAIVAFDGFLVYGAMAMLFSTDAAKSVYLARRRPVDRVCGAIISDIAVCQRFPWKCQASGLCD